MVNNGLWLFSINALGIGSFWWSECYVRWNKDTDLKMVFCHGAASGSSLGTELQTWPSLLVAATMVVRLLVCKVTVELGRRKWEQVKLEITQTLLLLIIFSRLFFFFQIRILKIVAGLWLTSRVMKMLVLTMFSSVFLLLWNSKLQRSLPSFCKSHHALNFWKLIFTSEWD